MAYQYELVLFDLDGTLTDSGLGIMNSVQYALKKIGRGVENGRILPGILRRKRDA